MAYHCRLADPFWGLAGTRPAKSLKLTWNACARRLCRRRNVVCALASTKSSCTWRMAIWRTVLCRQFQTSAPINTVVPLKIDLRFPLSIARAVRAVVPKAVPLGARITGQRLARRRDLLLMMRVAIANALKGEGLDFICISSGGVAADIRNPTEPGYNVSIAARVKKEAGIPTRTVGLIVKPEHAEEIVAKGARRPGFNGAVLSRRSALGLARGEGAGRGGRRGRRNISGPAQNSGHRPRRKPESDAR